MRYDPDSHDAGLKLHQDLVLMLAKSGFTEENPEGVKERVFSRPVSEDVRVIVYTSITDGGPRGRGKDAIRVCAVRKFPGDKERGIVKTTRVNRVGEIEAIVGRTLQRMRKAWKAASVMMHKTCPDCGAGVFISKKGNEVCSDLCWTK